MYDRQSNLLDRANWAVGALEGHTAAANLWKYTCPVTGEDFWTSKKQTSIRSPFTGKTFTAKPDKDSLSDVGKEIKKDQEAAKEKKAAANLYKYTCPETGQDFWTSKKQTTIRSPFTGKTFTAKPDRDTLSDVGKEIKKDQAAAKDEKKEPKTASMGIRLAFRVVDVDEFETRHFASHKEALAFVEGLTAKAGEGVEIKWG